MDSYPPPNRSHPRLTSGVHNLPLVIHLAVFTPLIASAQIPPALTRQPASLSRSAGDRITLSVNATGDEPLSYQWRRNGVALEGANSRLLTLTNLAPAHAGSYTVIVSNPAGSTVSEAGIVGIDTTFTFVTESPIGREFTWGPSWGDYDNDGFADLYMAGELGHLLFHNERDGRFSKVGDTNTLVARSYPASWLGAAYWADYDEDGNLDLFAPIGWGNGAVQNHLFRGLGNGGFVSVTNAPVGTERTEGTSAGWADFNRDGILDLFVANLAQDEASAKPIRNTLYLGQADGSFVRWRPPGFEAFQARNYGCPVGDFNGDGFPDIALSMRQNGVPMDAVLFNLNGTDFEPVSLAGTGFNYGGILAGDYDNNGSLDLFGAWVNKNGNRLFRNDGLGNFTTLADVGPALEPARALSGAWGDYDNDGFLDLFLPRTAVEAGSDNNDSLWRNNGDGTFTRIEAGSLGNDGIDSYGAAWGDYDNDGFLDLVVAGTSSRLYHNNGNTSGWLVLRLVGTKSNRSAIGAKVRLTATLRGGSVLQYREVGTGNSFGQNDPRVHFGLADATIADTIEIEWPSGTKQTLSAVKARQFFTITEPDDQLRIRLEKSDSGNVPLHLVISGTGADTALIESSADLRTWSEFGRATPWSGNLGHLGLKTGLSDAKLFFRARKP